MKRTTVGAVLRSNQAYYAQVCSTESLTWGIAYWNSAYPGVPETNQFREVLMPDAAALPEAFAAVERFFAERGTLCRQWTLAAEQPADPLAPFLASKNYCRRDSLAMVLPEWPTLPADPAVRILPARAVRAAYRETCGGAEPASAEIADERLNDAQFDMFVAMSGGQPAGHGALFQVGDIGRVKDLFVLPAMRGRGVANALLVHLLTMARRLAMRIVCLQVGAANAAGKSLCAKFGFEPDGTIVEFDAPQVSAPARV